LRFAVSHASILRSISRIAKVRRILPLARAPEDKKETLFSLQIALWKNDEVRFFFAVVHRGEKTTSFLTFFFSQRGVGFSLLKRTLFQVKLVKQSVKMRPEPMAP